MPAMKAVATPCMIAVPSMLMVAPSGTVNEAIRFLTPRHLVAVSMVTGIVAFEEAVESEHDRVFHLLQEQFRAQTSEDLEQ